MEARVTDRTDTPGALRTRTPCVGRCSTTYGDLVCRGCKRFAHEIVQWNQYDAATRHAVWQRLLQLRDQVVAGRLEVVNDALLRSQLARHRIRVADDDSAASCVYLLLRRGAPHMRQLQAYGLRALPEYVHLSPRELLDLIDADYQRLSEAHLERYFQQPLAGGST